MSGLTAVSLFAGIGGIDLALKRAGVHVAAAVEIDQAARGVLARHFPETALFEDVTEVTGEQLRAAGLCSRTGSSRRRMALPGKLGRRPSRRPG